MQDKKSKHYKLTGTDSNTITHSYGARYGTEPIPKYHIASKGIDAEAAYQLIHDELALGNSSLAVTISKIHSTHRWFAHPEPREFRSYLDASTS